MADRVEKKRVNHFMGAVYFALVGLITLVFGSPCIIIAFFQPHGDLAYWFIRKWATAILWTCGVTVEIEGLENVPAEGSFVVMSTHCSHFDIPSLIYAVPRQFRIVAKKELFRIPVLGWVMAAAGYVKVDRSNKEQAFASLDRAVEKVVRGMPLLIFPEGTRSHDGSLQAFKKGGFVLANKAKLPVIPIIVQGTFDVLPKSTLRVRPGPVKVTFCSPIEASSYGSDGKEELMQQVRQSILQGR
jgi:1-acyl-sn-glycerol-3-phosphate acyltransferase